MLSLSRAEIIVLSKSFFSDEALNKPTSDIAGETSPLLIYAIKSSIFDLKTKKHKEIKIEDFKGLSDDQLNTLITGATFLFSPPDPSKPRQSLRAKSKPAGK
jgi:hypothetical protein